MNDRKNASPAKRKERDTQDVAEELEFIEYHEAIRATLVKHTQPGVVCWHQFCPVFHLSPLSASRPHTTAGP